jgi:hypothetical protein
MTNRTINFAQPNVGIVGATGLVGEILRAILAERDFPLSSLRLFASARSAGTTLRWREQDIIVEDAAIADYAGLDIVFFSAGGSTSLEPGAAIRRFRWSSPRSIRTRCAPFPRASSPIRTARPWRRCRRSSRCTRRRD